MRVSAIWPESKYFFRINLAAIAQRETISSINRLNCGLENDNARKIAIIHRSEFPV
jgi:hypothetical protein